MSQSSTKYHELGAPLHAREYALVQRSNTSVSIVLRRTKDSLGSDIDGTVAIINHTFRLTPDHYRVYCRGASAPTNFGSIHECIEFINQEIAKHGY